MKLTFVYKADDAYWNDGLKVAVDILSQSWDVRKQNGAYKPYITDFVLVWGALGSEQVTAVKDWPFLKGICIAGGPIDHPDIHKFDVVFVETRWHQKQFKRIGVNARLAFGTNTQLFKPIPEQHKIWEAIYPAAFATWKRHYLFAQKYKERGLCVGYVQPDNWEHECVDICYENGCTVLPQVTPEVLVYLYNASKKVYISSNSMGGGERAVLEGLACGCEVEVDSDNEKLVDLLADMKHKLLTEEHYAHELKKGIKEVL